MNESSLQTLDTFTLENIPDLDIVVLGALKLFESQTPPQIDTTKYKRPLVVGSGNAEATGRIIFEKIDAVFASESTYESKLQNIPAIDGVVLISASGAKHAPIIARRAKELGKSVMLITTTQESEAAHMLDFEHGDSEYIFPKNREPYTYNTSTYMGMILGSTGEDVSSIIHFIQERVETLDFSKFRAANKYYLIVPTYFSGIIRMTQLKFTELFGRIIAHDIETSEYVKHATTVIPSDEIFISFGYENTTWGNESMRLHVPLPENAGYVAMMAISYYVIGKIQKVNPPYFKENIEKYTQEISQIFGETINPIVAK